MNILSKYYHTFKRQSKILLAATGICFFASTSALATNSSTHPSNNPIEHGYCQKTTITTRTGVALNIYKPVGCVPHMAFGTMPSKDNPHIIYCAEAAFTRRELGYFVHSNICGDHVADMRFYEGTHVSANNGFFVYYDSTFRFIEGDSYNEFRKASKYRDGIGFEQALVINNGAPLTRLWSTFGGAHEYYRCFCEREGELCIIDSKDRVNFRDFIMALSYYKVRNAICLDMGGGWNHSFYRNEANELKIIWPKGHNHCTNWIYFTDGPLPAPDTATVRPAIISTVDTNENGVVVATRIDPNKNTTPTKPKTSTAKKSSTPKKYHTVKEGENLGKIAQKYHTTVDKIKKLNPTIKNVDKIKPGQKIRVK